MSQDIRRLADQIIDSVEARVMAKLGSMAYLEHRFGTVNTVSTEVVNGTTYTVASVFLGGDTIASTGFRVPSSISITSGNRVRVVIDRAGDRWVEQKF